MFDSPQHAFGQMIGNLVELAIYAPLKQVADEFGLFLDQKRPRAARGGKSKVRWTDDRGNAHDLDYVLEQDGAESVIGRPKAFIEIAWRRYTKHSKNKAQEIEGAVGHLRNRYHEDSPFIGAILAGEFTVPAIKQLESHGFEVLYFPYSSVIEAFASESIDVAFAEGTADSVVEEKIEQFKALTEAQKVGIAEKLLTTHAEDVEGFMTALRVSLTRRVEAVFVLPLHGSGQELATLDDAIVFLENYDEAPSKHQFRRYEVIVRFSHGVKINGEFPSKQEAVEFLQRMV